MSSTESIAFNTLPEFTSDEVEQKVYDKTLGILIGKGMSFNNDELEKIGNRFGKKITEKDIMRSIHKWLFDKKKQLGIELGTYGADYIKIKDDGSIVGSAMYEMAYHFDCEMIPVAHPNNFGSKNKYIGNNSKGLLSESDVTNLISFLLSDDSKYINGQNIVILISILFLMSTTAVVGRQPTLR